MNTAGFEVPPLTRLQIRQAAAITRERLDCTTDSYLDVGWVYEVLHLWLPGWSYEIVDAGYLGNMHGLTNPNCKLIQIPEDVYDGACKGVGRGRLTLMHETGHAVLHAGVGLAMRRVASSIPAFRDSEWQANAFAGEMLVFEPLAKKINSISKLAKEFGVSMDAARIQWNAIHKSRT